MLKGKAESKLSLQRGTKQSQRQCKTEGRFPALTVAASQNVETKWKGKMNCWPLQGNQSCGLRPDQDEAHRGEPTGHSWLWPHVGRQ